jgi:hypothetical protein
VRRSDVAATEIAQKFAKAITANDTDGLSKLMSNHVFVDSLGNRFPASPMRSGWQEYFTMVPDYWIKVDQIVSEKNAVILFGSAGGTLVPKGGVMKPENKWETLSGVASTSQRRKSRRVAYVSRQRADTRKAESRCVVKCILTRRTIVHEQNTSRMPQLRPS